MIMDLTTNKYQSYLKRFLLPLGTCPSIQAGRGKIFELPDFCQKKIDMGLPKKKQRKCTRTRRQHLRCSFTQQLSWKESMALF